MKKIILSSLMATAAVVSLSGEASARASRNLGCQRQMEAPPAAAPSSGGRCQSRPSTSSARGTTGPSTTVPSTSSCQFHPLLDQIATMNLGGGHTAAQLAFCYQHSEARKLTARKKASPSGSVLKTMKTEKKQKAENVLMSNRDLFEGGYAEGESNGGGDEFFVPFSTSVQVQKQPQGVIVYAPLSGGGMGMGDMRPPQQAPQVCPRAEESGPSTPSSISSRSSRSESPSSSSEDNVLGDTLAFGLGCLEGYSLGHEDGDTAGYVEGHEDGCSLGYGVGQEDGYRVGHNTGHNKGYINGHKYGRQQGYDKAYNNGYVAGHSDGSTYSYNHGCNDGYYQGYKEGYNCGNVNGASWGYQSGCNAGVFSQKQLLEQMKELLKNAELVREVPVYVQVPYPVQVPCDHSVAAPVEVVENVGENQTAPAVLTEPCVISMGTVTVSGDNGSEALATIDDSSSAGGSSSAASSPRSICGKDVFERLRFPDKTEKEIREMFGTLLTDSFTALQNCPPVEAAPDFAERVEEIDRMVNLYMLTPDVMTIASANVAAQLFVPEKQFVVSVKQSARALSLALEEGVLARNCAKKGHSCETKRARESVLSRFKNDFSPLVSALRSEEGTCSEAGSQCGDEEVETMEKPSILQKMFLTFSSL